MLSKGASSPSLVYNKATYMPYLWYLHLSLYADSVKCEMSMGMCNSCIPAEGKSWYMVNHKINQHHKKGMCLSPSVKAEQDLKQADPD